MTKKVSEEIERVTFITDKKVKEKLVYIADKQNRTLSNYLHNIMTEYVKDIQIKED